MQLATPLLGELAREAATTRRVLERVPDDRFDWQPHPKSMTLKALAVHLATVPAWGAATLAGTEFDLAQAEDRRPEIGSTEELLRFFDGAVGDFEERLGRADDAALLAPWTLKKQGAVVVTLPRAAVLRSIIFNHSIHHRGQLSVFLRLLDVPVPSIYGPSADEAPAW